MALHGMSFGATPPRLSQRDVTGLYALTQSSSFDESVYQLEITGMSMRVPWRTLEPTKGNYNWSRFDTLISKCRQYGKVAKLFVMLGDNTPTWVGAAEIPGTNTPVPWDPNLRAEVKTLINAIGNRYRDTPEVAFFQVVGPSSQWAELRLPPETTSVAGYSNAVILDCWKEVIDEWKKVYGNKRLACSVSDAPTFYGALDDDICTYAVGGRFNPNDSGVLGRDFHPQWCYLDTQFASGIRSDANRWINKTFIGMQAWGSTTWTSPKMTDFEGTVRLAQEVGSTFIEIYQEDLRISSLAAIAEQVDLEMKAQFIQTSADPQWCAYAE